MVLSAFATDIHHTFDESNDTPLSVLPSSLAAILYIATAGLHDWAGLGVGWKCNII
jgi:hypothetical protein